MKSLALLPTLLVFASCADDYSLQTYTAPLIETSRTAMGVLALLNDPQVGLELLDDDVALDVRAARNLITHRNGPDGFVGTPDDDTFQTIAEVDAVSYVGPSALGKLRSYAEAHAYLPGPEDILGSWEGVLFTAGQAEEVLQLCNQESVASLDDEIGLDRRAAESIFDARPVQSMEHLASLYYVGPGALRKLKDIVAISSERIDCQSSDECPEAQRCEGIPYDASSYYGKCRPLGSVAGMGATCSSEQPCGPDLFCGGLTMWQQGMCIGEWQQDRFHNTSFLAVAEQASVMSSVVVSGQATVPFDITVDLALSYQEPAALRIVLLDPNGTDAVLWNGPEEDGRALPTSFVALGNISRDDVVNGRWRLEITNTSQAHSAALEGWSLWLSSNFD